MPVTVTSLPVIWIVPSFLSTMELLPLNSLICSIALISMSASVEPIVIFCLTVVDWVASKSRSLP